MIGTTSIISQEEIKYRLENMKQEPIEYCEEELINYSYEQLEEYPKSKEYNYNHNESISNESNIMTIGHHNHAEQSFLSSDLQINNHEENLRNYWNHNLTYSINEGFVNLEAENYINFLAQIPDAIPINNILIQVRNHHPRQNNAEAVGSASASRLDMSGSTSTMITNRNRYRMKKYARRTLGYKRKNRVCSCNCGLHREDQGRTHDPDSLIEQNMYEDTNSDEPQVCNLLI